MSRTSKRPGEWVCRGNSPALRAALASALGTAIVAFAPQAFAAETTAPAAAQEDSASSISIEDVVVTGSRIRGAAPVGSPVVGVSREEVVESGAITTVQLMQELPQILNLGISENSRSTPGGAGNITYGSGLNVHGIGPQATLTLLNGRRIVPSGSSGGLPDPNEIPTLFLERVEVVADGASAIYGSDAIAGVVNLITRRNYEGIEAQVHYGQGDEYDENNAGLLAGFSWETGNVTAAYEHAHHSSLSGRDRDFYRGDLRDRGGGDFRSNQCAPGTIVTGGVSYALPSMTPGTQNFCDNLKAADLIPEQTRDSFAAGVTQRVGDRVTLTFDGFYSERDFVFHGGTPNGSLNVPSTNAFFVSPPGTTPTSEIVRYSFINDVDPNLIGSHGGSKVYQVTGALTWDIGRDFQLEADYTYGRDESISISEYGLNNGALNAALASSNPATAFNPFGGTNSASVIDGIFNSVFNAPGLNQEYQTGVKLDGPLFKLPGGEVRIAIGGEYVRDSILTGLDSGVRGNVTSTRVSVKRDIKAAYAEVLVPIFGFDNAVTGIRQLDVSLAGRRTEYSDVGSTNNPKYGLNWSPVDGLIVRGSYGRSFRAPGLTSIRGPVSALFVQTYSTPTGPITGVALNNFKDGNDVKPEEATTYSFGFDVTPELIPDVGISINYFDVNYTGQISGILSDLSILQNPQTEAQYANLIIRNPSPEFIASFVNDGYPVFGALPNPVGVFVYGTPQNLGVTDASGLDFQFRYSPGEFRFGLDGSYFTKFDVAVTPTAPKVSRLDNIFYPPRFRTRGSAAWQHGAWNLAGYVNYTGDYLNNRAAIPQEVDAFTTVDLHVAYDFSSAAQWMESLSVALDFSNVLDEEPPFVNIAQSGNGGGGFDPTAANPIGRLIALSVRTKF